MMNWFSMFRLANLARTLEQLPCQLGKPLFDTKTLRVFSKTLFRIVGQTSAKCRRIRGRGSAECRTLRVVGDRWCLKGLAIHPPKSRRDACAPSVRGAGVPTRAASRASRGSRLGRKAPPGAPRTERSGQGEWERGEGGRSPALRGLKNFSSSDGPLERFLARGYV